MVRSMRTLALWGVALAASASATVPPQWHLPARCEEGDVNGLVQFNGAWHLFQQWAARPATSVGHAVSRDLLHWTRVADALAPPPGAGADEQCYDGSVSLVTGANGVLTPVLMIDGGCGFKAAGSSPCMESSGNGSTGGVTAVPSNLSDPLLTNWTVRGPTVFLGCDGSSGPSPMLRNAATGRLQVIAIHGRGEALFEPCSDGDVTCWSMVDPAFLPLRGGGGGLWRTLPLPPNASVSAPWTHIMQLDDADGDGAPTFSLLAVDAARSAVLNMTQPAPVDIGAGVRYGMLSTAGGADARTLHVSWLSSAPAPACKPPDVDTGVLTSFRHLQYDAALDRLLELPVDEYLALRGAVVATATNTTVSVTAAVVLALAAGPAAADVELNVWLPPGTALSVGVACNSSTVQACGAVVTLNASADGTSVTFTAARTSAQQTFPTPSRPFALRIMLDITTVEVFAANGAGVYSDGITFDTCATTACNVAAWTSEPAGSSATVNGTAWELVSTHIPHAQ